MQVVGYHNKENKQMTETLPLHWIINPRSVMRGLTTHISRSREFNIASNAWWLLGAQSFIGPYERLKLEVVSNGQQKSKSDSADAFSALSVESHYVR